MTDRPILFSAPMVRALLAGTKTQTRRIAKTEITMGRDSILAPRRGKKHAPTYFLPEHAAEAAACCPYGQPGDRLWVRETFEDCSSALHSCVLYRADGGSPGIKWTPSIHMPRWASRIMLEVTGVRVERLQDISEADTLAEGITTSPGGMWSGAEGQAGTSQRAAYALLWQSINGPGSWEANPWVWAVEFKRVTP